MAFDFAELLDEIGIEQTCDIQPYAGAGSKGPTYSATVTGVRCYIDQKRRLVRTPTGDQVLSSATVYAALDVVAPPLSLVTFAGKTAKVLARVDADGAGADTPDHCELSLE
jgi:hypothetical protein